MTFDDRYLAQLTAESDVLEAEARRALPVAIAELSQLRDQRAEAGYRLDKHTIDGFTDSRCRLLHELRLAASALGGEIDGALAARLLGALAPPAFADPRCSLEAAVLLTAGTLESTAVAAHQAVLAAPGTAADTTLRGFARACISAHERHRVALDALLAAVGGSAREGFRPAYLPSVATPAAPRFGAGDLVAQVAVLEGLAAQTYRSDLATLGDGGTRQFLAAIADVAGHHVSCLRVLGAHGATDLLGLRAPSPPVPAVVRQPVAGMAHAV